MIWTWNPNNAIAARVSCGKAIRERQACRCPSVELLPSPFGRNALETRGVNASREDQLSMSNMGVARTKRGMLDIVQYCKKPTFLYRVQQL